MSDIDLLSRPARFLFERLCVHPDGIGTYRAGPIRELARCARHHGLLALLRHEAARGAVLGADDIEEQAGAACARLAALALLQSATASEAIKALAGHGIQALVFKGAGLAVGLYGAADLRESEDVDLLVDAADVIAADAVLRGLGFHRHKPHAQLTGRRWQLYRDTQHEYGYRHERTGVLLELHWRFAASVRMCPFTFADLHARSIRIPVAAGRIDLPTLAWLDAAYALALHCASDGISRLRWVADIPRLAMKLRAEDRDAMRETAAKHQLEPVLGLLDALMEVTRVPPALRLGSRRPGRSARERVLAQVFTRIALTERGEHYRSRLREKWHSWRCQFDACATFGQFTSVRYSDLITPADFDAFAGMPHWLTPVLPFVAQGQRAWRHLR